MKAGATKYEHPIIAKVMRELSGMTWGPVQDIVLEAMRAERAVVVAIINDYGKVGRLDLRLLEDAISKRGET